MKRLFLLLAVVLLVGTANADKIYLIAYEGYNFDPCSKNGGCLAISAYYVAPETVICTSTKCVEEHMEKTGIDHIEYIKEVNINPSKNTATVKSVSIKHKAVIEESKEEINLNDLTTGTGAFSIGELGEIIK